MDERWNDLPLREYRPEQTVKLPVHEVRRAAAPAVDIHNHLGQRPEVLRELAGRTGSCPWVAEDVEAVVGVMDECNVETSVNLDGDWGDMLEANLDRYDRAHPGRFVTFCRLDWSECGRAGWPGRLARSLGESIARGAAGLKVWKDVGLHVRDEEGDLVLCDDARLAPVWEAAAQAELPVLIHVADPPAFFEPLDERNERLEQLIRWPEWRFSDPSFPRFGQLMDALERLVASQPEVTFIGAHVGCNAEDLGWVDRMLSLYPNFFVDIAGRLADLGRQPRATRRLMLEHPTRVCFGTDAFSPTVDAFADYFRFLETDDECYPYSRENPPGRGRWTVSGLGLPKDVLASVYGGNARRIIPALRRPSRPSPSRAPGRADRARASTEDGNPGR